MDTTRLVEEYEAVHAKDSYIGDLETLYYGLMEDDPQSLNPVYSNKWADQQIAFLSNC